MSRYKRQKDIVPHEAIRSYTPTIVGCGAIGSQVAKQLVHMGSDVKLVDFDTVDEVNLACQGFKEEHLGLPKVEALAQELAEINSEVKITTFNRRYNSNEKNDPIVFMCVDQMSIRKLIYSKSLKSEFMVDGRMKGGDTIRIIQARKERPETYQDFAKTLFLDNEANNGSCTARTTIFGAYIAAGLMVSEYARWLRGFRVFTQDYLLNIPATEIDVL